ncbi:hypothetical protein HU200_044384 [Digitaria exilis]|uniref:Cyclin N-terminal domain-containing protein n=1 Tax=Digitaria exilis TaxID=1010633 RepID=A0A835AYB9_9POAL|nr:hypothetical protein HU200_044384 [Digitaria exilis]
MRAASYHGSTAACSASSPLLSLSAVAGCCSPSHLARLARHHGSRGGGGGGERVAGFIQAPSPPPVPPPRLQEARPTAHRQILRARILRRSLPPRASEVTHHSPILVWGDDCSSVLISRLGCVRKMGFCGARSGRVARSWLLEPLRDSNLELFALVAVWISSKIHDLRPLSVKSLKALGDRIIADQHFMCRDFADAVVEHNIGSSSIAFIYLEDLLIHFREISKLGDLLDMDVCMEILDILYETEDTSLLFNSPCSLAASTLVAAYVISVPKQAWEFPILPWVRFATSYNEEEIMKIVLTILLHVLKLDELKENDKEDFDVRCLL